MLAVLKKAIADGRTTPGSQQRNDVPVDIWKTKWGCPELLR